MAKNRIPPGRQAEEMHWERGYRYGTDTCHRCGAVVHTNWLIRHHKSGCKDGVEVQLPQPTSAGEDA